MTQASKAEQSKDLKLSHKQKPWKGYVVLKELQEIS